MDSPSVFDYIKCERKKMVDYSNFFTYLKTTALYDAAGAFADRTQMALRELAHGDFGRWAAAIEAMPDVHPSRVDLTAHAVTAAGAISDAQQTLLKDQLMQLHPWRKGPFDLFGVHIDTEWRSDLKWARLAQQIDLRDKLVLDVGCGNGYYLFRMLGAGAKAAVGVDPFLLYVMQFQAINNYIQTHKAAVLPLGIEDVPENCGCFDTVFSMGILYHRRQPRTHLADLRGFLKPGGQLVLETIVLDQPGEALLTPEGRYAKMRNVWAIPTPALLEQWLAASGFKAIQRIDISRTTPDEQRRTDWMTFESLTDFLDPADPNRTIEGHPAPVRAVMLAETA